MRLPVVQLNNWTFLMRRDLSAGLSGEAGQLNGVSGEGGS